MSNNESFSTSGIKHHRNIVWLMIFSPLVGILLVTLTIYMSNRPVTSAQTATGPSLTYLDNGTSALVNGQNKTIGRDIRGDGTITAVSGGVNYRSNSGERSENYVNGATNPLWSDNSSGWFAFDFVIHDQDNAWRVIEQEHEGDMSPTRALETSGTTLKIASRHGTPHVRGPDKSWNIKTVVPGERLQIVGYEKFGQGNAVFQGWWRKYGESNWNQFANSSNFSMGYTSGNPGRYHKRGTYHGSQDYNSVSSVTWYGTAVMHSSRSNAESAAGITNSGSTPTPTPTPPSPLPTPPPPSPNPTPPPTTSTQVPYTSAITIPGKIEAENYDKGGQGISYNDSDTINTGGKYRTDSVDIENSNEGGYSIGWIQPGEWMEYTTNITSSGLYDATFRVATGISGSGSWLLKNGSAVLATGTTSNTGGWYSWKNIEVKNINLTAGNNTVLRLESSGQAVNINYVTLTKQSSTVTPTTPSPAPAPSPSPAPTNPLPPISIPGSNPTKPVPIPDKLPANQDGTITGDFNGDGLNEVVKDINQDGQIDPSNEIIIDGSTNQELTDLSQSPLTPEEYEQLLNNVGYGEDIESSKTVSIKIGSEKEIKIPKPVAYTFITAGTVTFAGIGMYLALTKMAIFAAYRARLGL